MLWRLVGHADVALLANASWWQRNVTLCLAAVVTNSDEGHDSKENDETEYYNGNDFARAKRGLALLHAFVRNNMRHKGAHVINSVCRDCRGGGRDASG